MPQALLLGLHLRDAAGLRPEEGHLPPADPPLTPRVRVPGAEAAAAQWSRWWAAALADEHAALAGILPPSFTGLRGMPELRGVAELLLDDALEWSAWQRERESRLLRRLPSALFEVGLVRDLELGLGRRLPPVDLELVVLPVRGRSWSRLGDGRFLLPLELRADRDAYLAWLGERLRELMHAPRPSVAPGRPGSVDPGPPDPGPCRDE
ncbi:hypothetical protein CLV92_11820 [Kineococcus xinjiangensis]|uniref:Uncharacterized protein n=2 Tax=Kineococcus xinjiangensis TaxID=512762 RepID=A0A2S6ICT7_9ACTN|nr:hypothetical protein CLV92_11820 [Kineococcus xinjiangensis]